MPPGNPNWHLPKKDMPLVFQGKSPRELADQLKDPKRNGDKTLEQLVEHATNDKLVLWGWEPGDGRTKPPLSHEEFVKKFREWVEKGDCVAEVIVATSQVLMVASPSAAARQLRVACRERDRRPQSGRP